MVGGAISIAVNFGGKIISSSLTLTRTQNGVLSLTSLKALEEKLSSRRFMRIQRSYIVALDKITSMTRNSLQIGKKNITVGNQYKDAFN